MLAMTNSNKDAHGGKGPSAQELRPNANKGSEDARQGNDVLPPAIPFRLRQVFRGSLRTARPHAASKRLGFSGDDAEDQLDSLTPRGEVFVYGDRVLRRVLPKRLRGEDRQGAEAVGDQPERP